MTESDSDLNLNVTQGMSHEELHSYADLLLKTTELASMLRGLEPDAQDTTVRITDPRIIDQIELPLEISIFLSDTLKVECISYRFTHHKPRADKSSNNGLRASESHPANPTVGTMSIGINLSDDITFAIGTDNDHISGDGYTLSLAKGSGDRPLDTDTIDEKSVSDLVARTVFPSQDPSLQDFKDIRGINKQVEIRDTLLHSDLSSSSSERIFLFGDDYKVVMQTEDDRLLYVEVEEFTTDQERPTAMTLSFESFSNFGKLYLLDDNDDGNGSREVPLDAENVKRFLSIIEKLLKNRPVEIPSGLTVKQP